MAKGSNNGKPKKSYSFKPYDSSNSFVKRVTSRVSELLPQPSAWISRWLSPAVQSEGAETSSRWRQHDQDEDDQLLHRPPSKKICLANNVITDYSHRNNIRQTDDRRPVGEEISPILSSHIDDCAVPGPSGLHLRRKDRFVSSTPAVPTIPPPVPTGLDKVNGDDGSDSSDSTSGCSSLVPQADKTSSFSAKRSLHSSDVANMSSSSLSISKNPRSLFCKPKYPRVDFPTTPEGSSKGGVPTFNSLIFHSSFKNRSLNESTLKDDLNNASSFYRGRTMYGGASSCSEALNFGPSLSLSSVESPQVINIKPQNTPETSTRDTMGTTARKILDALEKFSTPVLDAKRIPVKKPNLKPPKRKLHQPYQELTIPQMPALLRIKRREALQNRTTAGEVSSIESSITTEPPKQPEQEYTLRKDDDSDSQKYLGSIKGKKKDELESEPPVQVNLPNVALPITSLPVIDISVKPQQPPVSKLPLVTNLPKPTLKQYDYKFSEPIIESHNTSSINSIRPTISFSDPIQPNEVSSTSELKTKQAVTDKPVSKAVKSNETLNPPLSGFLMKTSSNSFQLKRKSKEENVEKTVLGSLKPPAELKSGSVMDVLGAKSKEGFGDQFKPPEGSWQCKVCCVNNNKDKDKCIACETPKESKKKSDNTTGFGNQFKMTSDQWECGQCLVKNNVSSDTCVCCSQSKSGKAPEAPPSVSFKTSIPTPGFGDMFKPAAGSWDCKECFVRNKLSDNKCVACSSQKPGGEMKETQPSSDLKILFGLPEGSWKCNTCLVQNKSDNNACVACGILKPGATVPDKKEPSKPKFSFGIPAESSSTGGFSLKFGSSTVPPTSSKPTGEFFFNTDKGSSKNSVVPSTNFKFGMPFNSSVSETKSKPSSVITEQATNTFTSSESQKPSTGINCITSTAVETTVPTTVPSLPLVGTNVSFNSTATNAEQKGCSQVEEKEEKPAKKRVSFGEPLVEEKNISNDMNSSETFSYSGSSALPKIENQTPNSVLATKPSIFGNNLTFVPTTSSSPFVSLFNATSPSNSTVSSSISTFNSNKSVTSAPSFSVTSSSSSFATQDKKTNPLFGFLADKAKQFSADNQTPFSSSTTPSESKVTFENASNNEPQISSLGSNNEQCNIFGGTSENKPSLFSMSNTSEEKKPNFFTSTSAENKPSFFSENRNVFGANQGDSWGSSKPVFSSNAEPSPAFGTTPTVNTTSSFPGFGTTTSTFPSGNDTNKVLFTYNSLQQNQSTVPATNSLFSFKNETDKPQQQSFTFPAVTTTQTSGGFVFSPPQNTSSTNPPSTTYSAPTYGTPSATQNQTSATFGSSVFGSSGTMPPMFSFSSSVAGQPEQTAAPVFTFGAHQAPAKEVSSTASFAFGSQNASAPASAPAPTPSFDPNMKPTFNFSGGTAPIFTAVATPSSEMATPKNTDRKIRKAIRRTTALNR